MSTEYELRARETKAARIVGYVLWTLKPEQPVATIEAAEQSARDAICHNAGVTPASPATWELVIERLREIMEHPSLQQPDDALEGLPRGPR